MWVLVPRRARGRGVADSVRAFACCKVGMPLLRNSSAQSALSSLQLHVLASRHRGSRADHTAMFIGVAQGLCVLGKGASKQVGKIEVSDGPTLGLIR